MEWPRLLQVYLFLPLLLSGLSPLSTASALSFRKYWDFNLQKTKTHSYPWD